MKAYICTDIEGVAGVTTFTTQAYEDGKYYEEAKRLLTGEVNAAVEGLLAEGVETALVLDGHGPGGINYESLHDRALLLHGRPLNILNDAFIEYVREFDFGVMLGQHAMAGRRFGNLNHTQNSRGIDYYKLNGRLIGEIAQFSLHCGALGLPMIFLSGDEEACAEAKELLPGVVTAAVKRGMGRNSAISVSMAEAHRRIREGAAEAVRQFKARRPAPLVWPGPFALEKRFFHTDVADQVAQFPGAERVDDQTVVLRSADILDIIYR